MTNRIKLTPDQTKNAQGTITSPDGTVYKDSSPVKDTSGNQYNVKRFMYPEDLENNPEHGGQMVVFFINVATVSQANNGQTGQTTYDIPPEDISNFSGTKVTAKVPDTLDGHITASKMRRLDTAIAMHMPNQLKTNYAVNWGESTDEEMRGKDFLVESAMKVANASGFAGTGAAILQVGENAIKNTVVGAYGKYIQKTARVAQANSKQEQVFDGVQFRTFNFDYTFHPKSKTEAENIRNIYRMFRYHMLPEFLDELSFMYIYPSEFNIKYYSNGTENTYLEQLSTCVLKNISIDYTPNGQFATFTPDAGGAMPSQINISMEFQELSKPSKETSPWFSQGL